MNAVKHPVGDTKRIMPNLKVRLLVFVGWLAKLRHQLCYALALLHLGYTILPSSQIRGHSGLTTKLSDGSQPPMMFDLSLS
jgi:hypothetical protein